MGKTIPITKEDITNIQSRFENRNKDCTIYEKIKTIKTVIICEDSIPNENADIGAIFDCGEPTRIVLK